MLLQTLSCVIVKSIRREFSISHAHSIKVTVCGAGTAIGQPLSMLLKMNPLVSQLCLHDENKAKSVAADIAQMDFWSGTHGFVGPKDLPQALQCAELVLICAGIPREPSMDRIQFFNKNAAIVRDTVSVIPKSCPKAMIGIITNPMNSCVPVAAEVLKNAGIYNPKLLFGIPALNVMRARTFIAQEIADLDPRKVDIPVIGGQAGLTIIPLTSQCSPRFPTDREFLKKLTTKMQDACSELLVGKDSECSSALAAAYAVSRTADSCLRALKGEMNITECLFVESQLTAAPYFASPVLLNKKGIHKIPELPRLNDYEDQLLRDAIPILQKSAEKGIKFVQSKPLQKTISKVVETPPTNVAVAGGNKK